jgi:hypothetical protein
MQLEAGRRSKNDVKLVKRGAPPPIRRAHEDVPQVQFVAALELFARSVNMREEDRERLKGYRDAIPFVALRDNQQYLAAALVVHRVLGQPTSEQFERIDAKRYHAVADPVLGQLRALIATSKRPESKTSQKAKQAKQAAEQEAQEQQRAGMTLFRHVAMVARALGEL